MKTKEHLFGGVVMGVLVVGGIALGGYDFKNGAVSASVFLLSKATVQSVKISSPVVSPLPTVVAKVVPAPSSFVHPDVDGDDDIPIPAAQVAAPEKVPVKEDLSDLQTIAAVESELAAGNGNSGTNTSAGSSSSSGTTSIPVTCPKEGCTCNALYAFGGHNWDALLSDMWDFSPSTGSWIEAMSNAPWGGRRYFGSLIFNGKMWVMGGETSFGGQTTNDVWAFNGTTAHLVAANVPWTHRKRFGAVVFNNRMWIMGGNDGNGNLLSDVWSSSDGVSWSEATAAAPWGGREQFTTTVFDNKIWVMGGYSYLAGGSFLNDVWSSPDGIHWTQVSANAAWTARTDAVLLSFNNKMWMLGGYDAQSPGSGYRNDVWESSDGVHWIQATASAAWSGRSEFTGTVADNKMWISGGAGATAYANDLWSSVDGVHWVAATTNAPWQARDGLTIRFFPCQ